MCQWKCIQALLHLKVRIDRLKAMKQLPLTNREREVLREGLERTYEQAEFLLSPQVMQALASDETTTTGEGEGTSECRIVMGAKESVYELL